MLFRSATPSPVGDIPKAVDGLAVEFGGWQRIAADPPADLDPWAAERVDELCELAAAGLESLDGDTLMHGDVRADNIIVQPDGTVTLVDWPHACLGPSWLDSALLMVNVLLYGGRPDVPDVARPALAGIAGFFLDGARQPPPPGLPTVRAFQKAQGDAVLAWLRDAG